MILGARKFIRLIKLIVAGVSVFCVSWIASVNEWHSGAPWSRSVVQEHASTMRTLVGYSEAKQAELDRPSPVSCNRLPALPKIPDINRTWSPGSQESSWQHVEGTSVSLYSAYYDDRLPQRYIRILAMFRGHKLSEEPLFCQTRSKNPNEYSVEVVAAKPLEIWWKNWDNTTLDVSTPLLLSCPLTDTLKGRSVVSVVTQPCEDPTNAIQFERLASDHHKYTKTFTICVKDLDFQKDISYNLIEWIETNKLLGVDMIDMYIDSLSKENEEVLMRYRSQGFVRLFHVPVKYKSERSLWQRRRDHVITYNDCLYRNIAESKFIVPLDVDEILLPKIANTWPALIKRLRYKGWNPKRHSAILVRNVFFFDFLQGVFSYKSNSSEVYIKRDNVRINDKKDKTLQDLELTNDNGNIKDKINSKYSDMIHYKYKSECGKELPTPKLTSHVVSSAFISPVGRYSKSIMATKRVLTAFNHYPLASLGSASIAGWSAPFEEVQLNHYKSGKTSLVNFLSESINIEEAGTPRPTQGVRVVEFELPQNSTIIEKQQKVDLEMWDCSGDHKFESCWPALRIGVQGVILVCSPNTVAVAGREIELLYNYFVSQAKLSAKQCVLFYNCMDDQEDMDSLNLSPTFSKVSQVPVNLKTGGNRLKIDFSNFISSVLQASNK